MEMTQKATAKDKLIKKLDTAMKQFNQKKMDEALASFSSLVKESEEFFDIAERSREYITIINELKSGKMTMPRSREEKYEFALIKYNEGDPETAEKALTAIKEKLEAKEEYLLALIYIELEDEEKGIEFLKKAFKSDPENRMLAYNNPDLSALRKNPDYKEIFCK
jgi:tetratricopeptide (TPR) repeat protein